MGESSDRQHLQQAQPSLVRRVMALPSVGRSSLHASKLPQGVTRLSRYRRAPELVKEAPTASLATIRADRVPLRRCGPPLACLPPNALGRQTTPSGLCGDAASLVLGSPLCARVGTLFATCVALCVSALVPLQPCQPSPASSALASSAPPRRPCTQFVYSRHCSRTTRVLLQNYV